jgi:uncharacterized membrane protein HdeD (DUF308 family)
MQPLDSSSAIALLGLASAISGVAMILFNLLSRRHRTGSWGSGFWAASSSFAAGEYAANRVGCVLVAAGALCVVAAIQ